MAKRQREKMEQVRPAETVGQCIANDRRRAVKADGVRAIVVAR